MKPAISKIVVALVTAAAVASSVFTTTVAAGQAQLERWSPQEKAVIASMQLSMAKERPFDPSNAYETRADAAAFGRALFNDARLSRNGQVSCASCHAAARQFQDGRAVGQGIGTGKRRTMPVMGASHSPFLFWDGRKDSLWSQALGPLEDASEHGGNRVRFVRLVHAQYRETYERLFGPLPVLKALPGDASPNGNEAERAAWAAMGDTARDEVNRVFANLGKAIAAYERQVRYGESRFDAYARATLAGDGAGQQALSPQEVRGLRLFIGKGQCATCHNGPLLTDHAFHNTGVPPLDAKAPDRGRAQGVQKLLADEFNCLGRYSDARREQCGELQFLSSDNPTLEGSFRTPSLRNVAERAPYMHSGQFPSLQRVVEHYAQSPDAAIGRSELAKPGERHEGRQAIRLSPTEIEEVAAFLRALSGPVLQPD